MLIRLPQCYSVCLPLNSSSETWQIVLFSSTSMTRASTQQCSMRSQHNLWVLMRSDSCPESKLTLQTFELLHILPPRLWGIVSPHLSFCFCFRLIYPPFRVELISVCYCDRLLGPCIVFSPFGEIHHLRHLTRRLYRNSICRIRCFIC